MVNILGMDTCSQIRLSVIVPVYNAEKYVKDCLEALASAVNRDMEILLVDDGSTDQSGMICDSFAKKDLRFHAFHKKNRGVSSARNFALDRAVGKWVTFVDADDMPTKTLLDSNVKSDLLCFNWQYTTGESEQENLVDGIYEEEQMRTFLGSHLIDFIFRTPWGKLFKRSIIEEHHIRFNEDYRLGEDNLFVLDYLSCCQSIETKQALGYIYLRPSQSKYRIPLQYAMDYLTLFMEKYNRLGVSCLPLLSLLEYYYFMKVGNGSLKAKILWEGCLGVQNIRSIFWTRYSQKKKIKIVVFRLINKFLRIWEKLNIWMV